MGIITQTLGLAIGFMIAFAITIPIKWIVSQIENPYLAIGVMFFLFVVVMVILGLVARPMLCGGEDE